MSLHRPPSATAPLARPGATCAPAPVPGLPTGGAPGRAEREQRTRLLLALAASLLLHLLPSLLDWGRGQWGTAPPVLGRAVFVVSLSGTRDENGAPAAEDPTIPPRDRTVSGGAADPSPPAAGAEQTTPVTAVALTLGQQRLTAYQPPYLARLAPPTESSDAWYFPVSELTVPPRLLDTPPFDDAAGETGAEPHSGRLVLRVYLASDGKVDRVEVVASTMPEAVQQAALAALARARFRPGEIQGIAVTSSTRFEVNFDTSEGGSSHLSDRKRMRSALPHSPRHAAGG